MTDISSLQESWQDQISPILKSKQDAIDQREEYTAQLAEVEEKLRKAQGLSRLRSPFVKATKIAWLHHKQKKIDKHIEADKIDLANLAASALSSLGEKVARDSATGTEFTYLDAAIKDIRAAQSKVDNAAKKCRNASAAHGVAGVDNDIPLDKNIIRKDGSKNHVAILALAFRIGSDLLAYGATKKAVSSFREAEEAVRNLRTTLQNEAPYLNGEIADSLASSNNPALMIDLLLQGILGTFANWNMAKQLYSAKNHLGDVATQLGNMANKLSQDKSSLVRDALALARTSDADVKKFAAELQDYIAEGAAASLRNHKPPRP